jgi:hypothetical protein
VVLVGYSWEPLLQTICYYKPQQLILVLNKDYGKKTGDEIGQMIARQIQQLTTQPNEKCEALLEIPPTIGPRDGDGYFHEVEPEPSAVFRFLTKVLHALPSHEIVIDVTGAKKSMATGAFLYAAFANVNISYVEFDDTDYNFAVDRPYGYLSAIQQLSNPYDAFALREWARVRTLYTQYRFKDARRELLSIAKGTSDYYTKDFKRATDLLDNALECYTYWDSGDFLRAREKANELPSFLPPTVVTYLGCPGKWFTIGHVDFNKQDFPLRFYDEADAFNAYVYDELERTKRLVRYAQDYRAAFLRAAGVNETLMMARLVDLMHPSRKEELLNILRDRTPNIRGLFHRLRTETEEYIHVKDLYVGRKRNKTPPRLSFYMSEPMKAWWKDTLFSDEERGWEDFLEIRNKLSHTYVPVSEEVARAGLEFTRANFEDHLGYKMEDLRVTMGAKEEQVITEAMNWSELCQWCGLDKVLPASLIADVDIRNTGGQHNAFI